MSLGSATKTDPSRIDPGIADLVRELNEAGIPTIGSCEGGCGHAFARPTVQIRLDPEDVAKQLTRPWIEGHMDYWRGKVREFMRKKRPNTAYTVSIHLLVQPSGLPMYESYVELELW